MLQAHSLLWHYLWLAPHALQLVLAVFLVRRGLHKVFPLFFTYLIVEAAEEFTLYAMDVLPSVTWETFWRAFCIGLVIEGLLKFALIAELFAHLVQSWPAVATIGRRLISGAGAALILIATFTAGYAPVDNPQHAIISRAHLLEQTVYIVQCGLILFLFVFSAYFHLNWNHRALGILLGFGIVSCQHMGAWAVMANGLMMDQRHLLDLLNMATYHFAVILWIYYLLWPEKPRTRPVVSIPEHNLDLWNRELERLLQQ